MTRKFDNQWIFGLGLGDGATSPTIRTCERAHIRLLTMNQSVPEPNNSNAWADLELSQTWSDLTL